MTQTRFTPDLDLDGLSPDEAFTILGNEIRIEIIRVLWRSDAVHKYDDGSDAVETMSYSELQQEIDVDDNGKFNYHLSVLAPHFIRRTDDGYRLSGAGKQIARTVIAVPEQIASTSLQSLKRIVRCAGHVCRPPTVTSGFASGVPSATDCSATKRRRGRSFSRTTRLQD